jgi:hypothetical protein
VLGTFKRKARSMLVLVVVHDVLNSALVMLFKAKNICASLAYKVNLPSLVIIDEYWPPLRRTRV